MDFAQLSALLGGSLSTIIVQSIIDYFSKGKEHMRLLEATTYERRLKIAETSVAFYSHYRYNVIQMKSGLQTVKDVVSKIEEDPNLNFDMNLLQEQLKKVGLTIDAMFGTNYENVLAMNLYFDFSQSKYFKVDNLLAMNNGIGKTKAIDAEIGFWADASTEEHNKGNAELSDDYLDKALELFPIYCTELDNVIKALDLDSLGAEEIIASIKKQIKIY